MQFIDSMIHMWVSWIREQERALDSALSVQDRAESVLKCEELINQKYYNMQLCDEYFKCLEKKN